MSISNRFDGPSAVARTGPAVGMLVFASVLLVCLLLTGVPTAQAQAAGAKRAIEKLEACEERERKSRCVVILKVEAGEGDRQAIKAQIRGRRIIWYEYDRKTGRVRRTN